MAMTTTQMVELFTEQAEMHWAAVGTAKDAANDQLAAFKVSAAFESRLMVGLLQWRLNEDPRTSLAGACAFAREGLTVLAALQPGFSHWMAFDFAQAGFVRDLVGEVLPRQFEPDLGESRSHGLDHMGSFLDRTLVAAMESGEAPADWEAMTGSLSEPYYGLARETYSTYMEIITHSRVGALGETLRAVSRAARLFKKRRDDDYFAGGRGTDGGGPDNAHVVDFRLAALVRSRVPEAISSLPPDERVHLWSW